MKTSMTRAMIMVALVGVLALPWQAYGAGFGLYEGSARGNALGGALTAAADDPSALFYNPAGITQLEGIQVMGGATFITPMVDVTTVNPYNNASSKTGSEENTWIPPFLYATYQFNDQLYFGLGVFSRFGLGTEFDENWAGRYNSYNAVIKTVSVNPNVAFKLNDWISLAAGMEFMYFDLTLENKVDLLGKNDPSTTNFDVDNSLTGDTMGYGFNLGIRMQPRDWIAFGANYRSQVRQHLDGTADFTAPANLNLPSILFNDTGASGTITLPQELFLGVAVWPMERLMVEFDAIYTGWSSFDELTINFDEAPAPGEESVTVPKNWDNVWRFGVGVEYKALDWLDLRLGYIYDQTPIPDSTVDYLVPASDRQMLAVGTGIHWKTWTLDLSYTYLMIKDRDVDGRTESGVYDGEFKNGDAHLIGAGLSYRF